MNRPLQAVTRRAFTAGGLGALATLGLSPLAAGQSTGNMGKSVSADVEKANVRIVNDFCAAFARKDFDKAISLLADNCVYRPTQTRPPVVSKQKVAETIKGFIGRAEFKVLKTVVLGPLVVNERDDVIAQANGPTRTFHVAAGVFFVENGKIVEWTDYLLQ